MHVCFKALNTVNQLVAIIIKISNISVPVRRLIVSQQIIRNDTLSFFFFTRNIFVIFVENVRTSQQQSVTVPAGLHTLVRQQ